MKTSLGIGKALPYVRNVPRAFRMIWQAAPGWTVAWAVVLLGQGILPVATVYLTKLLIDSLVAAVQSGNVWAHSRPVVIFALATAAITLLSQFLSSASEWIRAAQSEIVQDHIKGLVHEQSLNVDLSFYEHPDFFDHMDRARSEAGNRSLALLENVGALLQKSITLIAMAAVLITYSIWIPLILIVSTLPALLVVVYYDRQYHRWWQNRTQDRRLAQYHDLLLTDSSAAAEVRLFGVGNHLRSAYNALRKRLRNERLKQVRRQSLAKLGATLIAFFVAGLTMAWMLWRVMHGKATLGDLALFYQAFNQGQGLVSSLLGSAGQIFTNSLFLSNLFTFLDLKPIVLSPAEPLTPPPTLREGIAFRNVTFYYPGSERPSLANFDLFIPAGKVVAIVGANGAGKTTLLKLLCRFFDPQEGSIEMDGVNIRGFEPNKLWQMITMLFQYPVSFCMTAAQSIAFSNIGTVQSADKIRSAARAAGAHDVIARLPKGYDTMLGRMFDGGAQLSGGEWQRIAMARAYLRDSPIILLDEPTSFMDSWSEADWFDRFRNLARGRTGVIITHRFTIAMRADIIHVMRDGQIVESGTHKELLIKDGMYALSWKAQMEAASAKLDNPDDTELTLRREFELQTSQPN